MALQPRRSARVPAQPQRLADDQAGIRIHEQELADLRAAALRSIEPDVASESDEETAEVTESSASESEEEEGENTAPHAPWAPQTHAITRPPFTALPASVLPRHRQPTELGYLQCFLPPSLVDTIATNTNLYAAFKQAPPGWATTPAEVWRFIAVHLFMGIIELPYLHMYWEGQWRQPYVTDTFSRDRFMEILRYFHIAEPTPLGVKHTVDKKIKPLYYHCLATFPEYFTPPEMLTLDETMVRFKGRSTYKTVIKGKPTPIGYKLYTIASLGYLLTFSLYRGKGGYAVKQGVIHHTVTQMVGRWSGSDRILFTDNLYTSPALCRHLLGIGLRSCGTFRPNRSHLPEGLRDAMKTLSTGETKAWQSGQLGCLVWCDKNPVLILSTHHKVDDMVSLAQDHGPSQAPFVIKPQVVLDYNVGKCGVDMVDQLRSYYAMQRKSRKDWPSLAWWLIDMCVINSYTLWRLDAKAEIGQLDFRRALLHQIPAAYPPPSAHAHSAASHSPSTTNEGHWPKHSHVTRRCKHCYVAGGGGRRSEVVCKRCDVHLCLEPCFELYHTQ